MADAVWGAAVALGCGVAGLAVPATIVRLPEPARSVGLRPGLALRTALACAAAGALLAIGLADRRIDLLVCLPLVPPAVLLAVVDRHTHLLPSRVVWPLLGLTAALILLVGALTGDGAALVRAVIGGAGVFAVFHLLWWIRPSGMGYGDVRLSAVVGSTLGLLGWGELVVGVYAGFLGFALVAIARAIVARDRGLLRVASPYGPYLLGGALLGAVAGDVLWRHLVGG